MSRKYRLTKIHGFDPFKPKPPFQHNVKSYGFMPEGPHEFYEVRKDGDSVILFDQRQFIKKNYDKVLQNQNSQPQKAHSLIQNCIEANKLCLFTFLSSQPSNIDNLFLGTLNKQVQEQAFQAQPHGILGKIYKKMSQNKQIGTFTTLSIIGIQTQNILIDELNFEWLEDAGTERLTQKEAREAVQRRKHLKIIKHQADNRSIYAQNLTNQQIKSVEELNQVLFNYCLLRKQIKQWQQHEPIGELYRFAELQMDDQCTYRSTYIKRILQSYWVLKINQVQKGSARLIMRLSKCLEQKKQNHQSKILLFLGNCFLNHCSKYIFCQVGRYSSLKEEAALLYSAQKCERWSEQSPNKKTNIKDATFLHYKYYRDKVPIIAFVKNLQSIPLMLQSVHDRQTFENGEMKLVEKPYFSSQHLGDPIGLKSYYADTLSSSYRNQEKYWERLQKKQKTQFENYESMNNSLQDAYGIKEDNFGEQASSNCSQEAQLNAIQDNKVNSGFNIKEHGNQIEVEYVDDPIKLQVEQDKQGSN